MATRSRTTRDEWTIQGNYGYGWDDLTAHDSWKEARDEAKVYRDNEPQAAHRIVKRRVPLEAHA